MVQTTELAFPSFKYFECIYERSHKNCILIMDKDGAIITINQAFSNWFGYLPEDIAGRHLSILFTPENKREGAPEKEISQVLQTGYATDDNYLVCKDNSLQWVSGESMLVQDEAGNARIMKIVYNIQQQKTMEQSVQHSNNFNENILGIVSDAVIVLDKQLNIIKTNKTFDELFNHYFKEKPPLRFHDLSAGHDAFKLVQQHVEEAIALYKNCTRHTAEVEVASGETRVFDVTCNFPDNFAEGDNVVIALHDVTLYKHAERDREDAIGFVAHELRNPLSNLMLVGELLTELTKENSSPQVADLLQRNKKNILRLNKMINELYDATTANSGNLRLDLFDFNLWEMLLEAIGTIEALQPDNKIIFEGNAEITIHADKYRLIQVVTNYLANAIKYSPSNATVTLHCTYDDNSVTVKVEDKGIGISWLHLPMVFNRFFRAEKGHKREGIGLGLYLSRKIIQAHNGKVWAESEEGKGSSFYFSIPRYQNNV